MKLYSITARAAVRLEAMLLKKPADRARAVNRDENGSVLLLTAMMAFVATIFAMFASETSRAVYNRITAQNAADAAAHAAALWQARGCNLIQQINNYHYDMNKLYRETESSALNSCVLAAVLKLCPLPPCVVAQKIVCVACGSAPWWDDAQDLTAAAMLTEQEILTYTVPVQAAWAANQAAQGSGADLALPAIGSYIGDVLSKMGIGFEPHGASKPLSAMFNKLGAVPIYALPLDPTSLKMGLERQRAKEGDSPWDWSGRWGPCLKERIAGMGACRDAFPAFRDPRSTLSKAGAGKPGSRNWGWHRDEYYTGYPGVMTWIAFKKEEQMPVLSSLAWLSGRKATENVSYDFMNQKKGLSMYSGQTLRGESTPLKAPTISAIASSQVDGKDGTKWKGVVSRNPTPNAYPYLVPVQLPPSSSPKAGLSVGIFH